MLLCSINRLVRLLYIIVEPEPFVNNICLLFAVILPLFGQFVLPVIIKQKQQPRVYFQSIWTNACNKHGDAKIWRLFVRPIDNFICLPICINFFQLAARFPLLVKHYIGNEPQEQQSIASNSSSFCFIWHVLGSETMAMRWHNLHLTGTSKAGNIFTEGFNNTMSSHFWHYVILCYSRAQTRGNKDDKYSSWEQQQLLGQRVRWLLKTSLLLRFIHLQKI